MMQEKSKTMSHDVRNDFITIYGGVYEHSPWVVQAVLDLPNKDNILSDHGLLASAMAAIVDEAGYTKQLELLRAHPDLAGRLAVHNQLTKPSQAEQAGAGLDQCTPAELARFQQLNKDYTEKFGFPFIVAVAGLNRSEILDLFEKRIKNTPEQEFTTALQQVHKIARLRLEAMD